MGALVASGGCSRHAARMTLADRGKNDVRIHRPPVARQDFHLVEALDRLLAEVFAGQRPLRVLRMMKMYNDPTMNPYLYKARGQAAA